MKRQERDANEMLPLAALPFHILLALSEGERHGYAIRRSVEEASEGALRPGAGSLYHALAQLEAAGAIEESDERPDPHLDQQRRRYYRLSDYGRRVLLAEMARLEALLARAKPWRRLQERDA